MAPPVATDVQGIMDTQIATLSDRLSVNGVPARRSKAPKIGGGVAAHASSDMFKSPVRASIVYRVLKDTNKKEGIWQAEG